MSLRIIWLPLATDDLEAIVAYIDRRSTRMGTIVATRINETVDSLVDMPTRGSLVRDDRSQRHRQLHCWNYRIIYRVYSDAVVVASISHGARKLTQDTFNR